MASRGRERRAFFRAPEDYARWLAEATARYHWRLHSYVLMPNHGDNVGGINYSSVDKAIAL